MIKKLKYFLTLFVIGLGIINFSFGSSSFEYHNIGVATDINGLNVSVETYGNLLSDSKKLLNFGNNTFVFWTEDLTGNILLYAYTSDGGLMNGDFQQGFFNTFQLCDEITNLDNDPQNCILRYTYENLEYLHNFMANVTSSDIYGIIKNADWHNVYFTISSSSLGKSLYFTSQFSNNFINSLNIGSYSFENLPTSLLYNSPAYSGGGGNGEGGEGGEGSNNDILINSSCSKQKALNYYENKGYTKKLCYGGYDDFTIWNGSSTGVLPYYGSGLDIEEIWLETANYYQGGITGDSQSYKAWFGYRRQMYSTYKRGGYSSNPFVNTPLVMFGLFGAVDTYGSSYNSNEILEYCDLKLYTADYTVAYTGINYNNVCTSPISFLDDQINDIISGSGYNGTGSIGINTNEILSGAGISLSGDLLTGSNSGYVEGSNFILDFSQKLKNNFGDISNNSYGQGILPIYITLALLGLILFRFMSH